MAEHTLAAQQQALSAHLRNPQAAPPPADVEARRLEVYRDLLYRNVESFIARGFPVLRSLTPDVRWHAMIADYFARHRARTPLFPRMPQEFLLYLSQTRDDPTDPPFLRELAHYEWLEAEVLYDAREVGDAPAVAVGDWAKVAAVPNPVLRAHCYRYPVHRIGPQQQPTEPPAQPTYLAVFRRRDDSAGFMELNAVSARLLELILAEPQTPAQRLLSQIAAELAHPEPAVVLRGGYEILDAFLDRELILGGCPVAG